MLDSSDVYPRSWAIVQFLTGLVLSVACLYAISFLLTILFRRDTRSKPYNIYLIFLILPDAQLNCIWAVARLYEAFNEGQYTQTLCLTRNGSAFFYYFSNIWLNMVVAHEVYTLVVNSHRRVRTKPPTLRKVFCQVAGVYAFTGALAAWAILMVPWSPYTTTDSLYCHTNIGGEIISKGWATVIAFMLVIPPMCYVCLVYYRMWSLKLLPKTGRTRAISMYFFRILVVYFIFYLPNSTIAVVYMYIDDLAIQFWLLWVFGALIPVQCWVTIRLALTKDDIAQATSQSSFMAMFRPTKTFLSIFFRSDILTCCEPRRGETTDTANEKLRCDPILSEWVQDDIYDSDGADNVIVVGQGDT